MFLDGSWKPEPLQCSFTKKSKPRLEWLDKKTLAPIISSWHSCLKCVIIISHKQFLGPSGASLICVRHLGTQMSYPHRWCWWSPACCRGCTRSWRTRPRCDTLHWCTGWNRIRWYLKHVQTHTWGQGWEADWNGSSSAFGKRNVCAFFPWATCLLETKCNTSGNNVTSYRPWLLVVGKNDKIHLDVRQHKVRMCAWKCSPSQVSESGLKTNPLGQEQV